NGQGFYRALRAPVHQGWSANQLSHFTHDRARAVGMECLEGTRLKVPDEIDIAGQDYIKAVALLTDFEQRLTGRVGADFAKSTDPLDLGRLQGEDLLVALLIGGRHGG